MVFKNNFNLKGSIDVCITKNNKQKAISTIRKMTKRLKKLGLINKKSCGLYIGLRNSILKVNSVHVIKKSL